MTKRAPTDLRGSPASVPRDPRAEQLLGATGNKPRSLLASLWNHRHALKLRPWGRRAIPQTAKIMLPKDWERVDRASLPVVAAGNLIGRWKCVIWNSHAYMVETGPASPALASADLCEGFPGLWLAEIDVAGVLGHCRHWYCQRSRRRSYRCQRRHPRNFEPDATFTNVIPRATLSPAMPV